MMDFRRYCVDLLEKFYSYFINLLFIYYWYFISYLFHIYFMFTSSLVHVLVMFCSSFAHLLLIRARRGGVRVWESRSWESHSWESHSWKVTVGKSQTPRFFRNCNVKIGRRPPASKIAARAARSALDLYIYQAIIFWKTLNKNGPLFPSFPHGAPSAHLCVFKFSNFRV